MDIRTVRKRSELLGKEFQTNNHGKCVVVDYNGAKDVTVMFYEPRCSVKCQTSQLKDGTISNPLYPSVYGVGFMGVGKYSYKDKRAVNLWRRMLNRVFNSIYHDSRPSYKDVTVCEEWLNFQNFAEWCYSQKFFNAKDDKGKPYQLDKDILYKGNKIYSPETCCFVPQYINTVLNSCGKARGEYPIGVAYFKKVDKFISGFFIKGTRKHLGYYNTVEEAFQAYKEAKEDYLSLIAESYKNDIDHKLYTALLEYKVEIDD